MSRLVYQTATKMKSEFKIYVLKTCNVSDGRITYRLATNAPGGLYSEVYYKGDLPKTRLGFFIKRNAIRNSIRAAIEVIFSCLTIEKEYATRTSFDIKFEFGNKYEMRSKNCMIIIKRPNHDADNEIRIKKISTDLVIPIKESEIRLFYEAYSSLIVEEFSKC